MYDNYNIHTTYYYIRRFKGKFEEFGEIVTFEEHTISLYPPFYTPRNSSSKCIATPPTINNAHMTTGIVDMPIVLSADSPIQPKNPKTIIIVGTVLAKTIPRSSAPILAPPPTEQFFRQRDGSSVSHHQWFRTADLENKSENYKFEERWLSLSEGFDAFFFSYPPFFYTFTVMKKHNQPHPQPLMPPQRMGTARFVFSNDFLLRLSCNLYMNLPIKILSNMRACRLKSFEIFLDFFICDIPHPIYQELDRTRLEVLS